jgi:phage-related protein
MIIKCILEPISYICKALYPVIVKIGEGIKYGFNKLIDCIKYILTKCYEGLQQMVKFIKLTMISFKDYIVVPLYLAIVKCCLFLKDNVLLPLINFISKVLLATLDLLKRAILRLYDLIRATCNYIMYIVSEILYGIKLATIKTIDIIKRLTFYLQGKIIDISNWIRSVVYLIYCKVSQYV